MTQDKTIIRKAHDKDNPYVIIDRTIFEDNSISWKSKGLMGYFLSRPDDWTIWLTDLVKRSTDGRHATRTALIELEKAGYITRKTVRDKGKFAGNEILVYESPIEEQYRTASDFPTSVNPTSENRTYTNNNSTNNNYTKKELCSANTESNDSDSNESGTSVPIKPDESKLDGRGVFVYDFPDNELIEFECCCDSILDVRHLKKSKCKCPICETPIEVRDSHGTITHKPFTPKKKPRVLGDIIPDCPVKLAEFAYQNNDQKKRISLLLKQNRGILLNALNWAINQYIAEGWNAKMVIDNGITAATKRINAASKPDMQPEDLKGKDYYDNGWSLDD